jgi:hypothetical protein
VKEPVKPAPKFGSVELVEHDAGVAAATRGGGLSPQESNGRPVPNAAQFHQPLSSMPLSGDSLNVCEKPISRYALMRTEGALRGGVPFSFLPVKSGPLLCDPARHTARSSANLLLAMAHVGGAETDKFGASTGRVEL